MDQRSARGPKGAVGQSRAGASAPEGPGSRREDQRTVLILGNLTVGKSTLMEQLCDEPPRIEPFPGTTVLVGRGSLVQGHIRFLLIDTPGIDTIHAGNEDETVARTVLLGEGPDIVVLVADGRNLRKSLLLTMEIAEYGIPIVLCINMLDEAQQRGVKVDTRKLHFVLGVPVIPTIATEGEGVGALRKALRRAERPALSVQYPARLEETIDFVTLLLGRPGQGCRGLSAALVAGDWQAKRTVAALHGNDVLREIEEAAQSVQLEAARPLSSILSEARLAVVDRILSQVLSVEPPAVSPLSERIGRWARRPLTGYPIAALVVLALYLFVGRFGAGFLVDLTERQLFGRWIIPATRWALEPVPSELVRDAFLGRFGLVSVGLSLAFGIVLPVLGTFFFALAILEDSGYLPRLSVLVDRFFRRLGLNGRAVLPTAMGFSCVTMAILATRVLETKRERLIATFLLVLGIPCAPVLAVMLVLLAGLSIWASVVVFGLLLVQVVVAGLVLERILPKMKSDFILELPPVRVPKLSNLVQKTAWRAWWFAREALPFFLIATFALFLMDRMGALAVVESAGKPILTGVLGLPPQSIEVVLLSVIRKESGAALLKQLSDSGQLDGVQVVVSLLLLVFLVPCVNSIVVLFRERGTRGAAVIMTLVSSYALAVGAVMNAICRALHVTFR
ncbi:MAG: ferrous iron transport protein B [Candidatus Riflebacteria bacterium]|nr:ferrous iron transport protein B [Candidatus Riflebacteria bacterium]